MVIEKIGGPLPDPILEGEGANGGAFLVKTSNFRFFNNEVRNSLGMALYLYGENLEVRNNYFHDLYSTAMQVNLKESDSSRTCASGHDRSGHIFDDQINLLRRDAILFSQRCAGPFDEQLQSDLVR